MIGYNENLPEIPYDPDEAMMLLAEAGYEDGFDLTISVKSSATQWEKTMMELAASMWEKAGVRAKVEVVPEDEWMSLRKSGQLACYAATWTADYNDPDNFIYTFFGNKDNTTFRSLCYPREDIMNRVQQARQITDQKERLQEYSNGMKASWNGSVKNNYRNMSVN